jgi:hypothetical protein
MDLTEGSETSAELNLMPGKYPKENIQVNAFVCQKGPKCILGCDYIETLLSGSQQRIFHDF